MKYNVIINALSRFAGMVAVATPLALSAGCGAPPETSEPTELVLQAIRLNTEVATSPHGGNGTKATNCYWWIPCINNDGLHNIKSFNHRAKGELTQMTVWSGKYVDWIQVTWRRADGILEFSGDRPQELGTVGGTAKTFTFQPGESIVRIDGRSGAFIDQFKITTSEGRTMRWGGVNNETGGTPWTENVAPFGRQIHGFFMQAGKYVDNITFFSYLP